MSVKRSISLFFLAASLLTSQKILGQSTYTASIETPQANAIGTSQIQLTTYVESEAGNPPLPVTPPDGTSLTYNVYDQNGGLVTQCSTGLNQSTQYYTGSCTFNLSPATYRVVAHFGGVYDSSGNYWYASDLTFHLETYAGGGGTVIGS